MNMGHINRVCGNKSNGYDARRKIEAHPYAYYANSKSMPLFAGFV